MLSANPFGGPVFWKDHTESTMDDAQNWWKACLEAGHPERATGAILGADFQTKGRGRLPDRQWHAPKGQGLTFTLILPALDGFPVSLILAWGIIQWLESRGLQARLKWPNDVLLGEQKIAGILAIGTGLRAGNPDWPQAYLCGMGLNVHQSDFSGTDMRRKPTSLELEGIQVSRETVFEELLVSLYTAVHTAPETTWQALDSRLWLRNAPTTIHNPFMEGADVSGTVRGLGRDGALLLEIDGGIQSVYSGE